MTLRVELAQANKAIASGEECAPLPRSQSPATIAVLPNPAWRRLTGPASATGIAALDAPTSGGTGLRAANTPNKRVELRNAEAQLRARHDIMAATLATIDPEHHEAVAEVFTREIAAYAAYRDSLVS